MAARDSNIDAILNDIEKMELAKFADNATLFEAVRKVVLFDVYFNGTLKAGEKANPLRNYCLSMVSQKGGFSNEQVGAELRATWEGVNMLEGALLTLSSYKTTPPVKVDDGKNPAR